MKTLDNVDYVVGEEDMEMDQKLCYADDIAEAFVECTGLVDIGTSREFVGAIRMVTADLKGDINYMFTLDELYIEPQAEKKHEETFSDCGNKISMEFYIHTFYGGELHPDLHMISILLK